MGVPVPSNICLFGYTAGAHAASPRQLEWQLLLRPIVRCDFSGGQIEMLLGVRSPDRLVVCNVPHCQDPDQYMEEMPIASCDQIP